MPSFLGQLEPGRPFECAITPKGDLRPLEPGRLKALAQRRGEVVLVHELTLSERRRDRANRYWFVAIVATVKDLWQRELEQKRAAAGLTGPPILIPKEAVHSKLVEVFGGGLVDTPLGPARTSSATKSVKAFHQMTEDVREWVLHRYGHPIPSADEWRDDREAA